MDGCMGGQLAKFKNGRTAGLRRRLRSVSNAAAATTRNAMLYAAVNVRAPSERF